MQTLTIHLKRKYYNMILEGKKNVEYRECKPYWKKRIERILLSATEIIIYNGYTKDYIRGSIQWIRILDYNELPVYAKLEFKDSKYKYFYAIIFDNIREFR